MCYTKSYQNRYVYFLGGISVTEKMVKRSNPDAKNAIADMYLHLIKRKSPDKITVRELTEQCGVTRQAFYYHFPDIKGVMQYTIERAVNKIGSECTEIVGDYASFQHMLKGLFDLVQILKPILDSSLRGDAERFFLEGIRHIMPAVIDVHTPQIQLKNSDRRLILDFISCGLTGYLIEHCSDKNHDFEDTCKSLYHLVTEYRKVHFS